MAKRRTKETTIMRYEQKAYAIAKGIGLNDELAQRKAEAQTNAWAKGRSAYGELSKYLRERLVLESDIKTTFYGSIISLANFIYKEVSVRKTMDFDKAWEVAMAKWKLDEYLTSEQVEFVKSILNEYIAPTY
ncbi:MAG: hypothetical protein GXO43_02215 [Crenarchaeota archaeon]|nr:hypothetical protein [Thermoproteota archaeon]